MSVHPPGHIDSDVELGHVPAAGHSALTLWLWLVATSVLLLGMAIGPTREFIERIDEWWLDLMVAAEVDGLITLSEIVAFAGATEVSVPILLGAAIWLGRRASWDRLGVLLGAIILSEATLSILKALYGRPRPPAEFMLEVTRSSSFPSGHSIMAATTAIAFVYVFARAGNPARRWFYVAATYTVVMALSRIYLRVHWLSDVIVGSVIGIASVLASVWIVERFTVGISGALKSAFGWVARKQR